MNMELKKWGFGDEQALINLYDSYDRSCCDLHYPEPGKCTESEANWHIRRNVDMSYDGWGYARAIVLDRKVVGHIQYTKRADVYDANCDVEILLLPEACGKGVGSEAVKQMMNHAFYMCNYECMFATMLDTNIAARRMAEKAGMQYCGIDDSCEWTFHDEPCTKVIYGIRRPRKETTNSGVELKPWECRDIDALAHLYETVDNRYDDIVHPLLIRQHVKSLDEIKENRRELTLISMHEQVDLWNIWERRGDDIYRAIVNDGEIVGLICVRMQYGKQSLDGLLGYLMMPEHCGKGIATKAVRLMLEEAFRLRELYRISAWVYQPNIASARVLEKNGFRLEGVQRCGIRCEGKPTDHLLFGILQPEFNGNMDNNQLKLEL